MLVEAGRALEPPLWGELLEVAGVDILSGGHCDPCGQAPEAWDPGICRVSVGGTSRMSRPEGTMYRRVCAGSFPALLWRVAVLIAPFLLFGYL